MKLALRGKPIEDPLIAIVITKGRLAKYLGIQPSEVDRMTQEEIAGYMAYIEESAEMERQATEGAYKKVG